MQIHLDRPFFESNTAKEPDMPDNLNKIIDDALENPILSGVAKDIGKDLVDALIRELTLIPDPAVKNQNVWSTRKEAQQAETIHRLKDRVRSIVTQAFGQILAAGNPAAKAKLKDVKFSGDKITAGLEIEPTSNERHALADAAGGYVAVIMPTELDEYFDSMEDITAMKDQKDLPLDQASASDDKGPPPADPDPVKEEDREEPEPSGEDIELFEALNGNGIAIPVDEIVKFSSELRESAWRWVDAVESDDKVQPPAFLSQWAGDDAPTDATSDDDVVIIDDPYNQPEPDDSKPLEDQTKAELIQSALTAAASIGEGDITEKQFQRKTKPELIEYITWARGKLSDLAAAETADSSVVPAELEMLIMDLGTALGLSIAEADALKWDDAARQEISDYVANIKGGHIPDRVPDALGKYFSGGE